MQGYILNITKVKEEDLIVEILTENKLKTLYRFYGARHSNIQLGYKIDFEAVFGARSAMPMLRSVLHLSFHWNTEREKFFIWQQFIRLLFQHLRGVETLDAFYCELLDEMSQKWEKQNPLRVAVEAYVKILIYEGRLHDPFRCFVCERVIQEEAALARGFLPAHPHCLFGERFALKKIEKFFKSRSTLYLNDEEIKSLWKVVLEGF